jgi:hypothetical protein
MITIQVNGKIDLHKTIIANAKQLICVHDWIRVGRTYECPKCLSVTSIKPNEYEKSI